MDLPRHLGVPRIQLPDDVPGRVVAIDPEARHLPQQLSMLVLESILRIGRHPLLPRNLRADEVPLHAATNARDTDSRMNPARADFRDVHAISLR
jgi:hypothetical protein